LFPGTTYAATNNGWMEKEVFINYFQKSFIKTTRPSPQNPILLVYDGHSSHINIQLVEIAKEHNVTVLLLPPHSSHLLQPIDSSVFKSIKTTYDQRLCAWIRNHKQQKLPRQELSKIVCEIWLQLDKNLIINGFKKAGIFPFNNSVIDRTQFDPLSLKRWDNHQTTINNTNLNNEAFTSQLMTVQNKNDNIYKASTNQMYIVEEKTTVNGNK